MGKFKKNVVAFLLTFSLCLVGILQVSQEARAADGVGVVLLRSGSAKAYNVKEINFSLLNPQAASIVVGVPNPVGITIALYDLGHSYNTLVFEVLSVDSTSWHYDADSGKYYCYVYNAVADVGDYQLTLCIDTDTEYTVSVVQGAISGDGSVLFPGSPTEEPGYPDLVPGYPDDSADRYMLKVKNSKVTVTKGFSKKLAVSGAYGAVKWASDMPGVATVDQKGKVTAKKAGCATVTATDSRGFKDTCVVTVKNNVYSGQKIIPNSLPYGDAVLNVTKVSYDKKGGLIFKVALLNNTGYSIQKVKNVKVTAKNSSGKVIGKCSLKSRRVSVFSPGGTTLKLTMPKSKLRIKSVQDLREASAGVSGKYYYQY